MQLIHIDNESLDAWRQGNLEAVIDILSQTVQDGDHHGLANRALVRTRLKHWDQAERDARRVKPTILAHIAMSIALGGQRKLGPAKQAFNRVFLCNEPKSECLLLLIKSIVIFLAGGRDEAVKRWMDLAEACVEADRPLCYAVMAYMELLIGQTSLGEQDYQGALKSFSDISSLSSLSTLPELETVSLMFGWDFNTLLVSARQQTCEAHYGASQLNEAVEALQSVLEEFGAEIKGNVKLTDWVEGFKRRCVEAYETGGDTAAATGNNEDAITRYSAALSLDPPSRADLVVKRNKARLAVGAFDDAMKDLDEPGVPRFVMYQQIGEALLLADRTTETLKMLRRLGSDLEKDGAMSGDHGDWVTDFSQRCVKVLGASFSSPNVETSAPPSMTITSPLPKRMPVLLSRFRGAIRRSSTAINIPGLPMRGNNPTPATSRPPSPIPDSPAHEVLAVRPQPIAARSSSSSCK